MAYCLLSTHYHLLVQTVAPNLGKGIQRIHGRHAQLLNARQRTSGPLWCGRFHSTVLETVSHVVHAAAYIDANPVAAGVCAEPSEWQWSSYRANVGLSEPWGWHRPDLLHAFVAADAADAPAVYREIVAGSVERAKTRRG